MLQLPIALINANEGRSRLVLLHGSSALFTEDPSAVVFTSAADAIHALASGKVHRYFGYAGETAIANLIAKMPAYSDTEYFQVPPSIELSLHTALERIDNEAGFHVPSAEHAEASLQESMTHDGYTCPHPHGWLDFNTIVNKHGWREPAKGWEITCLEETAGSIVTKLSSMLVALTADIANKTAQRDALAAFIKNGVACGVPRQAKFPSGWAVRDRVLMPRAPAACK